MVFKYAFSSFITGAPDVLNSPPKKVVKIVLNFAPAWVIQNMHINAYGISDAHAKVPAFMEHQNTEI